MLSEYAKKLAATAEGQFDEFHLFGESDPELAAQIKRYWQQTGFTFPGVGTAWSAVFISWCVKKAGATSAEFKSEQGHGRFVHRAIQNATNNTGVFRGRPITQYAPQVGDIIHNNREGNTFDFQYAKTHKTYNSHSAIVIETGTDSNGKFALTVGGNESDSVRKKIVRLTEAGLIKQRTIDPYISVIQNLK